MSDLLTKISIICIMLGTILLIIISDKIDIPTSTIKSISERDINKIVKIKGTITNVINKGDSLKILEIKDREASINVILFKSSQVKIKEGTFIEISGKVSTYEGKLQIIAETIKL